MRYPQIPVHATSGQPFAVQALSDGRQFGYDANGNEITRTTYTQAFTPRTGSAITDTLGRAVTHITYDGDGAAGAEQRHDDPLPECLVEITIGPTERYTRTFLYAGGQRIAMRLDREGTWSALTYLHADHLGSTTLATWGQAPLARRIYLPVVLRAGGKARATGTGLGELIEAQRSPLPTPSAPQDRAVGGGTSRPSGRLPTRRGVADSPTQYRPYDETLDGELPVAGVTHYGYTAQALDRNRAILLPERWYDPALGRFIQPDTVWSRIPSHSTGTATSTTTRSDTDPSGHWFESVLDVAGIWDITHQAERVDLLDWRRLGCRCRLSGPPDRHRRRGCSEGGITRR